jgi:hypothetical protein
LGLDFKAKVVVSLQREQCYRCCTIPLTTSEIIQHMHSYSVSALISAIPDILNGFYMKFIEFCK